MIPGDVTAVILTRDEERNLPRALTSLPKGMPVLLIDALSRDHTVQFAKSAGARVIERPWTDYVDARRFAAAAVETPWTFMIDADEALDDVLRDAIVAAADSADGYYLKRTTYFCGKPMRMWRDEPLLRLFRTGRARLEARPAAGGDAALHERWTCQGQTETLPGTLLHFSYPDGASYRAKYQRYTDAEAAGLRGSPATLLLATAGGVAQFARLLLLKAAIADGPRGIYVAFHSAFYPAVVAFKALRR